MSNVSFVDAVIQGSAKVEDINDWIDSWHTSKNTTSLYDYLGLTIQDYRMWVQCASVLGVIIEDIKNKRGRSSSDAEIN